MKKTIMTAAICSAALAGAAAYADGQTAATGFYVEGQTGYVNQGGMKKLLNVSPKKKHLGGKIDIGYSFALTNDLFLGPELGLGYYGESEYKNLASNGSTLHVRSYAPDLLAVLNYQFADNVGFFVKGGMAYNELDIRGSHGSVATHARKFDPEVGAGFAFNMTRSLALTLTYTHIYGKNNSHDVMAPPQINSGMIGLKYTI